ncbi:MAG: hypothetical protein JW910_17370 [Anaerolineae bacterium]|nr:hypothetical protein [Anaerolineae bacterium]
MRRMIGLVLVIGLLLAALPLDAQEAVELASLRIGLWPEYDRAALLVIYWGELAADTSFPATLSFRIPASVPAPFVVAAQPAADAPPDEVADYGNTVAGDWRVITFTTNGPQFQFEYYIDLTRDGESRAPVFTWPGDYAVEQLSFEVQHPSGAENLTTNPLLPNSQVNSLDGLIYYGGTFGPLVEGVPFTLSITYTRSDDTLTVNLLDTLQPDTGTTSTTGTLTTTQPVAATEAVNIVLLVAVAVVSFLLGAATMRLALNRQERR